ncbi:MAG: Bax protein [Oleispira sp.]
MRLLQPIRTILRMTSLGLLLGLLTACDQSVNLTDEEESNPGSNSLTPAISIKEKKANFFSFLHPMIKKANADVLQQREQILGIQTNLPSLSDHEAEVLAALAKTYKVSDKLSLKQQIQELDVKINTIPASLVMAQAANESAWGTSRFAREGNNYFGQWCFSKGCGIVPNSRNSDAHHEVADFDSPYDSVKSYIRNLNRHATYAPLRDLRQQAIDSNQAVTGVVLAQGLIGYSERREEYVKEIQNMIRYNKLSRFNAPKIHNADAIEK